MVHFLWFRRKRNPFLQSNICWSESCCQKPCQIPQHWFDGGGEGLWWNWEPLLSIELSHAPFSISVVSMGIVVNFASDVPNIFFQDCSHPHKSFPTWGSPLNTRLSVTTWGRSQAFFPLKINAQLSFPTGGKESCFLLWSLSFPSFSPKCNPEMQCCPSPQILSHLYVRKDSSPFKMQNPQKMLPYKFLFFLLFISVYWFFFFFSFSFFKNYYYFLWIFFSFFFSPKLGILPQSGKIIPPAFGANNRRIDAPAYNVVHKAKKRKLFCCPQVEFLNIWVGRSENIYFFHLFPSKKIKKHPILQKLGAFPTPTFLFYFWRWEYRWPLRATTIFFFCL